MKVNRIIRDIDDGVMTIDMTGTITEINPSAEQLLSLEESFLGKKYTDIVKYTNDTRNDDFHEMIIQSIFESKVVHRKRVPYILKDGTRRVFDVSSSILWNEDETVKEGVFLSFSDVTEEEVMHQKEIDSAKIFTLLLGTICLWIFIFSFWNDFGRGLAPNMMSKILILVAMIPALIVWKGLHLRYNEIGLEYKHIGGVLLKDTAITVIGVILMILAKLLIMKIRPEFFAAGTPFIDMRKYPLTEWCSYVFSVILQEFISRGIVHECMLRIFPADKGGTLAILLSSFMFGSLHLHLGVVYMLGATALLGLLGIVYRKQRTIWGLCIPHYVLGMVLGLLGFVAY